MSRLITPREIVGFLQNPWFPGDTDPKIIERYRSDAAFRRRLLSRTLTGRRLMRAFRDWYGAIYWDNANPDPVNDPKGARPPNVAHMKQVLTTYMPALVLTFGNVAKDGIQMLRSRGLLYDGLTVLNFPHPNARNITNDYLDTIGLVVRHVTIS